MTVRIDNLPLLFAESDTPKQRVQKLNDLVNQLVNAVTDLTHEVVQLDKKIKQMEE